MGWSDEKCAYFRLIPSVLLCTTFLRVLCVLRVSSACSAFLPFVGLSPRLCVGPPSLGVLGVSAVKRAPRLHVGLCFGSTGRRRGAAGSCAGIAGDSPGITALCALATGSSAVAKARRAVVA